MSTAGASMELAMPRARMTITLDYEPRWGAAGRLLDRLLLHRAIAKMQQRLAERIRTYYESA